MISWYCNEHTRDATLNWLVALAPGLIPTYEIALKHWNEADSHRQRDTVEAFLEHNPDYRMPQPK